MPPHSIRPGRVIERGSMATPVAKHLSTDELKPGLDEIRRAPTDAGVVGLIVRQPCRGEREVLAEGVLISSERLVGDHGSRTAAHRRRTDLRTGRTQLGLISARVVDLVAAGDRERWALTGDQLYVDLDMSEANVPTGTRLTLGSAVIR